jgi:hypothetical protein
MSGAHQTAGPSRTDNFTAIFDAATSEYERVTGNQLHNHPFSAQLDSCDSPGAVSDVLQRQAQAFGKFREGDEKLMAWLDPTVQIIFTFSATLGEGIGLVSSLIIPVWLFSDILRLAVLTCKNNLYRDRRSSRRMFLPKSLVAISRDISILRPLGMLWQAMILSPTSSSA